MLRLTTTLIALVLCVALSPATAFAADTTVATVDMSTLIQKHPDAQTLETKFKQAQATAKANWDRAQEDMRKLAGEIEGLGRNDPARRRKQRQFEQQRLNNEFALKWAERQAVSDYVRALERIYQDVQIHVNTYARNNGIKLVLRRDTDDKKLEAAGLDDFGLKARLRVVVYSHPELDITEKVAAAIRASKENK